MQLPLCIIIDVTTLRFKICIETFEKKKSIINYLNITQKKSNYLNIQVVQKKKKEKNWIIEIQARAEIR